jgi:hypothetical protein
MRRAVSYILSASLLGLLAAPPIIAACGPGPINYVDANDLPAGGIRVFPGVLTCGQSLGVEDSGCDLTDEYLGCCVGPSLEGGALCIEAGVCPTGTGFVTCNETADCDVQADGTLQACCATFQRDAGTMSSSCAPHCAPPALQLCRTNGECPGDKCVVQKCVDGQTYEMCGLSTSATFPCTAVVPDGG